MQRSAIRCSLQRRGLRRSGGNLQISCGRRWRIEELVKEYEVEKIVLGLPKNMNNSEGERCEKTREFGQMLEKRTGIEVIFWDERLTSVEAGQIMMESGVRREERKEYVDKIAAGLILQGYLDARGIKE